MNINSVSQTSICKICGNAANLYGVTDFNTACIQDHVHGYIYPLSGVAIYYHQCDSCGLIYTNAFDNWSTDDYAKHIYNDEYVKFDPAYPKIRPQENASFLLKNFSAIARLSVLDYGSGSGQLAEELKLRGISISCWDPYGRDKNKPDGVFQLITCFEVFEHTANPKEVVSEISSLLDTDGFLFFTTLTNDSMQQKCMDNWYIAPRNGHISIYSKKSLTDLFSQFDMQVKTIDSSTHIAYKNNSSQAQRMNKT